MDSYEHRVKSYGKVIVPLFKLVGAVEAASFDAIVAGARGGASFTPKSPTSRGPRIAVADPSTLPAAPPASVEGPLASRRLRRSHQRRG